MALNGSLPSQAMSLDSLASQSDRLLTICICNTNASIPRQQVQKSTTLTSLCTASGEYVWGRPSKLKWIWKGPVSRTRESLESRGWRGGEGECAPRGSVSAGGGGGLPTRGCFRETVFSRLDCTVSEDCYLSCAHLTPSAWPWAGGSLRGIKYKRLKRYFSLLG